jgi:hypothetical protein
MSDVQQLRVEVQRTLRQASDEQLLRVIQFIDHLPSRRQFDDIVAGVRHRLAVVRPARPMTLGRVLTVPFEDLLLDAGGTSTADWLIPRDVLLVLHRLVLERLPADLTRKLDAGCANRAMDDHAAVLEVGRQLWPAAAAILEERLQDPTALSRIERLSDVVVPRLRRLALLLAHADALVEELGQLPPKPMGRLREEQVLAVLSLLTALRTISVDLFRCGCTILVRRSSKPGEVLWMMAEHDFGLKGDERTRLLTDAARECLEDVDATAALVERLRGKSTVAAADAALKMASIVGSLERAPSSIPVCQRQLSAVKAKASDTVLRTYEAGIGGEMYAMLEGLAAPTRASDEEALDAEAAARAIKKVEQAAGQLGLGHTVNRIMQRELVRYRSTLLAKQRSSDADDDAMDGVRLVEILFGSDEAMKLYEEL